MIFPFFLFIKQASYNSNCVGKATARIAPFNISVKKFELNQDNHLFTIYDNPHRPQRRYYSAVE